MKYFLILILSCTLALPAVAAKTVPGEVPVLAPLQPPPADQHMDGSSFFNSTPNGVEVKSDGEDGDAAATSTQDEARNNQNNLSQNNSTPFGPIDLSVGSFATTGRWLILILVALAIGFFVWFWLDQMKGKE